MGRRMRICQDGGALWSHDKHLFETRLPKFDAPASDRLRGLINGLLGLVDASWCKLP
jgi:hypothetical protein